MISPLPLYFFFLALNFSFIKVKLAFVYANDTIVYQPKVKVFFAGEDILVEDDGKGNYSSSYRIPLELNGEQSLTVLVNDPFENSAVFEKKIIEEGNAETITVEELTRTPKSKDWMDKVNSKNWEKIMKDNAGQEK